MEHRDVHHDDGAVEITTQPAQAFKGEFKLTHPSGDRHIQRGNRRLAQHPVVGEIVATLEGLDAGFERRGVGVFGDDRFITLGRGLQVAKRLQAHTQRNRPLEWFAHTN